MASGPPFAKRKLGERNPVHTQRLNLLSNPVQPLKEGEKAALVIVLSGELIDDAMRRWLDAIDKLECRDEGRITAALDLAKQLEGLMSDAVYLASASTTTVPKLHGPSDVV